METITLIYTFAHYGNFLQFCERIFLFTPMNIESLRDEITPILVKTIKKIIRNIRSSGILQSY